MSSASKGAPRGGGNKKDLQTLGDYRDQVRPLPPRSRRIPPAAPPPTRSPTSAGAPVFHTSNDGFRIEGARAGFEDLLRATKEGRFPISDTVDLHGLTVEEARRELRRFCERTRGRARRLSLVIHGKGAHSPGGRGVLRDEIASLLSSPPVAEHVLCFVTAAAKHGGPGAVYLLLDCWR